MISGFRHPMFPIMARGTTNLVKRHLSKSSYKIEGNFYDYPSITQAQANNLIIKAHDLWRNDIHNDKKDRFKGIMKYHCPEFSIESSMSYGRPTWSVVQNVALLLPLHEYQRLMEDIDSEIRPKKTGINF